MYDIQQIRKDFPILQTQVYGRPLVYFDNAATTQKPTCVIEAMQQLYYEANANVHRGVHFLSQKATDLHEAARENVRRYLGARSTSEIIFTRGTTESINLMATSFTEAFTQPGDEIILTQTEHHSNIVPWQLQAERRGLNLKVIPLNPEGHLDLSILPGLITSRTRLITLAHAGNVLGSINPVSEVIAMAHAHDIPVMIDGAQSAAHMPIDVSRLDCDFFACSGHKMYGPTGIGVLYGKEEWLDRMPPYQGGGEMIAKVTFEKTTYERLPFKFEAGTPDYVATHGLSTAIDYIREVDMAEIRKHENRLIDHFYQRVQEIPRILIYGQKVKEEPVISFNIGDVHHLDIGTLLDKLGFAVRTGHHCTQPIMDYYGVPGMVRASFGMYNTEDEVDRFIEALKKVAAMF